MLRSRITLPRVIGGAALLAVFGVLALPVRSADPLPDSQPTEVAGEVKTTWQVLSGGGLTGRAPNLTLSGTIGQCAAGMGGTAQRLAVAGFWQDFCCLIRGDVNRDRQIIVSDLTFLVNYLFKVGARPPCQEEANVDGLNGVNVADLTYLVCFLFRGCAAPPRCSP